MESGMNRYRAPPSDEARSLTALLALMASTPVIPTKEKPSPWIQSSSPPSSPP
jgi:hypothetical protein